MVGGNDEVANCAPRGDVHLVSPEPPAVGLLKNYLELDDGCPRMLFRNLARLKALTWPRIAEDDRFSVAGRSAG